MSYRLTRLWARLLLVVGLLFVGLGVVLAAVALFIDTTWTGMTFLAGLAERVLVAIFLILSGIIAGGPFVVFGQLILIFLDQRALLIRINARLRRWETRLPAPHPTAVGDVSLSSAARPSR